MRILAAIACLTLFEASAFAVPLFDVAFLLDESGSVSAPTFIAEKNFVATTVQSLTFGPSDTAASLITHATSARVIADFTTSKQSFINSNSSLLQAGGSSNLVPAVTAAQNQFNSFGRAGSQKIIVVLGDLNVADAGLTSKLDELAASGVHIFSFLLPGGSSPFMQTIVRNEGQFYVFGNSSTASSAFLDGMYAVVNTTPGDYNYNGVVDGADYVWWRFKLGTAGRIVNDSTPGVQQADYNVWRANFGQSAGSGEALPSVPEPSTLLLIFATLAVLSTRSRKSVPHNRVE